LGRAALLRVGTRSMGKTLSNENGRQLRTKEEVADRLRISTRQIDRLRSRGKFPEPIHISDNCVRWSDQAIDAFLAERELSRL
jgi:predicted DNA-binding transcriptional regulator AlpA